MIEFWNEWKNVISFIGGCFGIFAFIVVMIVNVINKKKGNK